MMTSLVLFCSPLYTFRVLARTAGRAGQDPWLAWPVRYGAPMALAGDSSCGRSSGSGSPDRGRALDPDDEPKIPGCDKSRHHCKLNSTGRIHTAENRIRTLERYGECAVMGSDSDDSDGSDDEESGPATPGVVCHAPPTHHPNPNNPADRRSYIAIARSCRFCHSCTSLAPEDPYDVCS